MQVDAMYDVVVVGGGAAGLSGAVALSRARRSVLVVDDGTPRNAGAGHVHNYLGREGTPPGELLAAGRAEAAGYGAALTHDTVTTAAAAEGGFEVGLGSGTQVRARRLLVSTGLTDELPGVPGLRERWGRDVLHCPYCHGYEVRDQAIGVLSTGPFAVHQAHLFRQLSPSVALLRHTGPELSSEQREELGARGIRMVDGEVTGLEITEDRLTGVRLVDGGVLALDALVVSPRFQARSGLLSALGLTAAAVEMAGYAIGSSIAAEPNGATRSPVSTSRATSATCGRR